MTIPLGPRTGHDSRKTGRADVLDWIEGVASSRTKGARANGKRTTPLACWVEPLEDVAFVLDRDRGIARARVEPVAGEHLEEGDGALERVGGQPPEHAGVPRGLSLGGRKLISIARAARPAAICSSTVSAAAARGPQIGQKALLLYTA